MRQHYRKGARFIADARGYYRRIDRNEAARIKAQAWAQERAQGDLGRAALVVLEALLFFGMRRVQGVLCPSYAAIASAACMHRDTAIEAVKRLEAAGYVKRISRRVMVGAGRLRRQVQATNLYQLFSPQAASVRVMALISAAVQSRKLPQDIKQGKEEWSRQGESAAGNARLKAALGRMARGVSTSSTR